ncbi:MAG: RNA polymerase sigma factor [Candidatus Schekmanbacteria bacterium]|nr:RNA polymerase sigma factor [Candidatus Schekmanbacteria bacterium]
MTESASELSPDGHQEHDHRGAQDTALILRAQQGDVTAFESLIAAYQRRILWLSFQLVGNYDDAQDVCQEVCIRLYRFLDKYDPNYRFFTWLYRLVVNASLDHIGKKRRRSAERSLDELAEISSGADRDPSPDPLDVVQQTQIRAHLAEVMELLTPQQKAAFILRDVEGLEGAEVATIMGCGMGTVRTHLHFARKKLRDELKARHPELVTGGGS